jgi:hypothetical protein
MNQKSSLRGVPHFVSRVLTANTDLISTPSAEAAQDAISRADAAQINRDRLQSALPRLRDRHTAALASERRDRWENEF